MDGDEDGGGYKEDQYSDADAEVFVRIVKVMVVITRWW